MNSIKILETYRAATLALVGCVVFTCCSPIAALASGAEPPVPQFEEPNAVYSWAPLAAVPAFYLPRPDNGGPPPSILATGTCSILVDPDRARISVASVGSGSTTWDARLEAGQTAEAVATEVGVLVLGDAVLEMSQPFTRFEEGDDGEVYTVSLLTEIVTSEIARMGEIVEVVGTIEGAEITEFVQFMSPDRRRAAEGDCLAIASGNAQARAARMASTLGATLGPIIAVEDENLPDFDATVVLPHGQGGASFQERRVPIELTVVVEYAIQ